LASLSYDRIFMLRLNYINKRGVSNNANCGHVAMFSNFAAKTSQMNQLPLITFDDSQIDVNFNGYVLSKSLESSLVSLDFGQEPNFMPVKSEPWAADISLARSVFLFPIFFGVQ